MQKHFGCQACQPGGCNGGMCAEEEWRLGVIFEILEARQNNVGMDGLSRRDLEEILYYTCTV